MQETIAMHPVSFLSDVTFERPGPVTIKELDRKITALQRKVDDLSAKITDVKQVYYWRGQNKGLAAMDLSTQLEEIKVLLLSPEGIWADCERVADVEALQSRISTLHKIQVTYFGFEKSINVLHGVDQSAFWGTYGTLSEMVDLLVRVLRPSMSAQQKVEELQAAFEGKHFDVVNESPRDIGIELLHLFEMAFTRVINQIKETQEAGKYLDSLASMLETIKKRILSFVRDSPRFSKDQPVYHYVDETDVQKVFTSIAKAKSQFSFWSMLSKVARIVSCVKAGECETFGGTMEKELGSQISGLAEKLHRKLVKIVQGKIAPEHAELFTKKLDLYGNCYMRLKASLQLKRQDIYKVTPDATFKALLNYAYGLRYELTEVGFLLDVVRELSTPQKLQLFRGQAILRAHVTARHKPLAEIYSVYTIGSCLKEAGGHLGEYSAFLKPSQALAQGLFSKLWQEAGTISEEAKGLWEALEKNEGVSTAYHLFFLKAATRACLTSNSYQLNPEHLLQLSCLRRDAAIQRNPLFVALLDEYDAQCAKWGIVDWLAKSHDVLELLFAAARNRPDVRLMANAYQKHTEFEQEKFPHALLHQATVKVLHRRKCWQPKGIEFRSLACVLYGTNSDEKRVSQEYIVANYHAIRQCQVADIEVLLFENTIAKIIGNDALIAEDELVYLIEGPLTEFIKNKKTDFDEMRIRLVIDKLMAKEIDKPEHEKIVTRLVARYG